MTVWSGTPQAIPSVFTVRQSGSQELYAKFEAQATITLFAKFVSRQASSESFKGIFVSRQASSTTLFTKLVVRQAGSATLKGILVVRQPGAFEIFAKFEAQATASLKGVFIARQSGSVTLKGVLVVRHPGSVTLSATLRISHEKYVDLGITHEAFILITRTLPQT